MKKTEFENLKRTWQLTNAVFFLMILVVLVVPTRTRDRNDDII